MVEITKAEIESSKNQQKISPLCILVIYSITKGKGAQPPITVKNQISKNTS